MPTKIYVGVTHDNDEYSSVRMCSATKDTVIHALLKLTTPRTEYMSYTKTHIYEINVPQQLIEAADKVIALGGTVSLPCSVLYDKTLAHRREYMNGTVIGVYDADYKAENIEKEFCQYLNEAMRC